MAQRKVGNQLGIKRTPYFNLKAITIPALEI